MKFAMTSKNFLHFAVKCVHRRVLSLNTIGSFKIIQKASHLTTHVRCFSTALDSQKPYVNLRTFDNTSEPYESPSRKTIKYHNEQEQILISAIEEGNPFSQTSWKELKEKVLAIPGNVNSVNIDAMAMGFCISARQYHVGLSILDQISASGKEPNLATFSRFLRLCYVCYQYPVPENVQRTIESVYLKLKSLYPVMDANSAEQVIHGLVLTNLWQESLELLSEIKVTCTPSNSTYNAIVKAAFDNNEAEMGWEVINKMLVDGRRPIPSTYFAWLDLCKKHKNMQQMVEKLLSFYSNNDLRPTKDVAGTIRQCLKREHPTWKSSMTSVNLKGVCKNCRNQLEKINISDEEFGALRSNFIDKVVVGSNVFLKTNPSELMAFERFLERSIPYTVVIDGLNVAYSAKSKKSAPHSAYLLQSTVQYFVERSEKVVLFGRKHMQSWPKRAMNYVFSNTKTFLADDISQDDPFLLFAAMYGGLGTCFVSRDLMRGHMYLLKTPELKAIFKRWQQRHQYQAVYIAEEGDVTFKPPLSFNPSVQRRTDGGWHIPYDEEFVANPPQTLDPPTHWLCLGPKPEKKQRKETTSDNSQTDKNGSS